MGEECGLISIKSHSQESTHVGEEADKMKGSGISLKQEAVQNRNEQLLMSQNTIPDLGRD